MGGPGRQGVEEMTPVTLMRDKVGSVKKGGWGEGRGEMLGEDGAAIQLHLIMEDVQLLQQLLAVVVWHEPGTGRDPKRSLVLGLFVHIHRRVHFYF